MRSVSPPRSRFQGSPSPTVVCVKEDPQELFLALSVIQKANDIARFFPPFSAEERTSAAFNVAAKQFRSLLEVLRCNPQHMSGVLWFDLSDNPKIIESRTMLHLPPNAISESKLTAFRAFEQSVVQRYIDSDGFFDENDASLATYAMFWPIREILTQPYMYCITTNMVYHYLMGFSSFIKLQDESLPRMLRASSSLQFVLQPLLTQGLLLNQPLVYEMGTTVPSFKADPPLHLAPNAPLPFSHDYAAVYWKQLRKLFDQRRKF